MIWYWSSFAVPLANSAERGPMAWRKTVWEGHNAKIRPTPPPHVAASRLRTQEPKAYRSARVAPCKVYSAGFIRDFHSNPLFRMRGRPVVGNAVPAWLVPASRLGSETSNQAAAHALRCPSTRVVARPHGFSLLGGRLEKDDVRRRSCHHLVPPLRAGVPPGEEGLLDEISTRKHDGNKAPAIDGGATWGVPTETASSQERGGEKKGRVRHRLNPMQVQQQALIRRLRTLEARRDWRGVLAAMVRRRGEIPGSRLEHASGTEQKLH